MNAKRKNELKKFATRIRIETMKEFKASGFGHIGGALSMVDLLSVLYSGIMKIDPQRPDWDGRDRLVISKGHAGPSLYATLALKGYFPLNWLVTLNKPHTRLPSHCDRTKTPGVDMTTGALGQGISTALGMALGFKLDGKDNRVYVVLGDGECDEGQIWEGALFSAHHQLDNLIVFVDNNGKQLDGYTDDVLKLGDLAAKFAEFGWAAQTVDGGDIEQIESAIETAKETKGKPSCLVLKTIKGAGIKEFEEMQANHHIILSAEMADKALKDLNDLMNALNEEVVV
ncbi:MAG: transketolase [Peptococcaceae bacterium]|nr:transketolase [Peptococcaceae bacterium]